MRTFLSSTYAWKSGTLAIGVVSPFFEIIHQPRFFSVFPVTEPAIVLHSCLFSFKLPTESVPSDQNCIIGCNFCFWHRMFWFNLWKTSGTRSCHRPSPWRHPSLLFVQSADIHGRRDLCWSLGNVVRYWRCFSFCRWRFF